MLSQDSNFLVDSSDGFQEYDRKLCGIKRIHVSVYARQQMSLHGVLFGLDASCTFNFGLDSHVTPALSDTETERAGNTIWPLWLV